MGNCQAAEAATVVIHRPDGKVERAYWSLSATEVMAANPGHYVAVVIDVARPPPPHTIVAPTYSSCSYRGGGGGGSARAGRGVPTTVKHLKLLRPDDTLHIGHVYRLVSFEEVLREFASKRHVKLSRLLAKQEKTITSRPRREGRGGGVDGEDGRSQRHSRRQGGGRARDAEPDSSPAMAATTMTEKEKEGKVEAELEEVVRGMVGMGRSTARLSASFGGGAAAAVRRQGQWRPALQSIAEAGS